MSIFARNRNALEKTRSVSKEVIDRVGRDSTMDYSKSMALSVFLAIVPSLILSLSLIGLFSSGQTIREAIDTADQFLPASAADLLTEELFALAEEGADSSLAVGAIISGLFTLIAMSGTLRAIMGALNRMYGIEEGRSIVTKIAVSLGLALAGAASAVTVFLAVNIGEELLVALSLQDTLGFLVEGLWAWLKWPIAIVVMMVIISVIYSVAPNRPEDFHLFTPGAAVATIAWLGFSQLFSLYVANFASFNATYGSLAGIIVLLLYIQYSCLLFLIGAQLNAVLADQ